MIEVYHLVPTRSVRVVWALEELKIPYVTREIRWPVRELQPEYLMLNPAGTMPVVVDNGVPMIESLAICETLARRYGDGRLLVHPAAPNHPRYLEWLWFGESSLAGQLSPIMRYGPHLPPEMQLPRAVSDAMEAYRQRLDLVEAWVGDSPYLMGESLTLADISLGYGLLVGALVGASDMFGPRTAAYFGRIASRPAFQKASAAPTEGEH